MAITAKRFADKSFKVLLILTVLFVGVFVQPRSQLQSADAALPLLVPILGAVVTDVAIDMGIDFVVDKAAKSKADTIANKLATKYGDLLKDLKPTKKNMGKWALKLPAVVMTEIVDEVVDLSKDTKKKDATRKATNSQPKKFNADIDTINTDPFYKTSIDIDSVQFPDMNTEHRILNGYVNEWVDYSFQPVAYAQKARVTMSTGEGSSRVDVAGALGSIVFYWSNSGSNNQLSLRESGTGRQIEGKLSDGVGGTVSSTKNTFSVPVNTGMFAGVPAFKKHLELLETKAKKVYYADGVLSTDGFEAYLDLPDGDDEPTATQMENIDFSKLPKMYQEREFEFDTDIDLSTYNDGDEFDYEVIQNDIVNKFENEINYIQNVTNITYNYDYEPEFNNEYEVSNPVKEEVADNITIIIDNDNDNDGSGSGDGFKYCVDKTTKQIVSCKDIEAVDGGLIAYIKNSYDYAVNAVKAGVDGVNTIVAGSAGLMTLYSNIFDWLPDEATVILTSGLLLMVGLRVFRK